MARGEYLSEKKEKETRIFNWAVTMKNANGAKAKERISENNRGQEWWPQNAKSGAYLGLEQEAPLHTRFFSDLEERSNRTSIHNGRSDPTRTAPE